MKSFLIVSAFALAFGASVSAKAADRAPQASVQTATETVDLSAAKRKARRVNCQTAPSSRACKNKQAT